MKKILLLFVFAALCILPTSSICQQFNKEIIFESSMDSTKRCESDLLTVMGITQRFEFGLMAFDPEYAKYKEKYSKAPEKLRVNQFASSVQYTDNKFVVNRIEVKLKAPNQDIENLLDEYAGGDSQKFSTQIAKQYLVGDKFLITLFNSSAPFRNNTLEIKCLDFVENTKIYDEFTKVGVSYCELGHAAQMENGNSWIYFAYHFDKKANKNGIAMIFEYRGHKWLFANKLDFLFSDGEVVSVDLNPTRKTERPLPMLINCVEQEIIVLDDAFVDKVFRSDVTKVKITGESTNSVFTLSPLNKYTLKVANFYKENNLLLD